MSPRSLSSLLVLAVGLAAQTGNFDTMLGQFEAQGKPTSAQLERNLAQIAGGLHHGGFAGNPRLRNYLSGVQGFIGGNRNLGLAMSGIYRQLGGLESNPQMAWLNYRNAYLMLNRFPMDNGIRSEMEEIRRGVEVVEARMPELPKLDWSSLDAESQKEYDGIMQRYISVSATASSAEVTAETMRRSMANQGLLARPEIVSGLTRMKLKLEDAKRLIEQKNYTTARERLNSAEAEAHKILKAFGG